ncbi:MAG: ATP-dependent DNA helicase RecG [Chloroflexota bacterium]
MADVELLTRIRRVLDHELHSGLRNRAVIGGLENHCPAWLLNLLGRRQPASELNDLAVAFQAYADLSAAEREGLVKRTIQCLDQYGSLQPDNPVAAGTAAPRSTKPPARTAKPPLSTSPRAPQARRAPSAPAPSKVPIFDAPISRLPGIRGVSATKLRNLGVETVLDLIYLFPRRYSEVRRIADLVPGEVQSIVGSVWKATKDSRRPGLTLINLIVADGTGTLPVTLFRAGRADWGPDYAVGERIMLTGPVELEFGLLRLKPHDIESRNVPGEVAPGHLIPIYPLSGDLRQSWLRSRIAETVSVWLSSLTDYLPAWVRNKWQLVDLQTAIRQIHSPQSWPALSKARRRLAFDELFLIQLGMLRRREEYRAGRVAARLIAKDEVLSSWRSSLPFPLTGAQQRVTAEIIADLSLPTPMMRLLQGEVGSGKTVVAAEALLTAVVSGFQSALMAPTEILAGQHFRTLDALFGRLGPVTRHNGEERALTVGLLTGSVKAAERRRLLDGLSSGQLDVIVGTHSLIQEAAQFARLGLAVVDEQHRFGVEQRAALREKGTHPHLLAMTATPIPRTLALTIYGDLDLSVLDEMPPGRQPVATRSLGPDDRQRAYAFIRKRVQSGEQVFIICPLVEESDKIEAKAATAEFERLQRDIFPDLALGLLHGRMKATDKERVMQSFRAGEVQVLVSTSVVEVGVDVPNATVMLVEGADRFGLAQLHQFRGRVGRGGQKAYCVLVAESPSAEAKERLQALERSQNGFELAEEDLRLRGPGEFFGVRQSGLPDLRIATLSDVLTIEEARAAAKELYERDPRLESAEHEALGRRVQSFWRSGEQLE